MALAPTPGARLRPSAGEGWETSGGTVADYDIAFNQRVQSMFADGVAWVKASGAWADRCTFCPLLIDYTDGSWDDSQIPMSTSNYSNGACLVNVNDTYCTTVDYLIDKGDNGIWPVSEDGERAAEEFFASKTVERVEVYFSMRFLNGNSSASDGWNSGLLRWRLV